MCDFAYILQSPFFSSRLIQTALPHLPFVLDSSLLSQVKKIQIDSGTAAPTETLIPEEVCRQDRVKIKVAMCFYSMVKALIWASGWAALSSTTFPSVSLISCDTTHSHNPLYSPWDIYKTRRLWTSDFCFRMGKKGGVFFPQNEVILVCIISWQR